MEGSSHVLMITSFFIFHHPGGFTVNCPVVQTSSSSDVTISTPVVSDSNGVVSYTYTYSNSNVNPAIVNQPLTATISAATNQVTLSGFLVGQNTITITARYTTGQIATCIFTYFRTGKTVA